MSEGEGGEGVGDVWGGVGRLRWLGGNLSGTNCPRPPKLENQSNLLEFLVINEQSTAKYVLRATEEG